MEQVSECDRSFGLEFPAVGYPSRARNNTHATNEVAFTIDTKISGITRVLLESWKQIRAVAREREGAVDLGNSTLAARDVYTSIALLYTRIYVYVYVDVAAFSINAYTLVCLNHSPRD